MSRNGGVEFLKQQVTGHRFAIGNASGQAFSSSVNRRDCDCMWQEEGLLQEVLCFTCKIIFLLKVWAKKFVLWKMKRTIIYWARK